MKTKLLIILGVVAVFVTVTFAGILTTLAPTKRPFQIIAPPTHSVKLIIVPADSGPTPDGYRIKQGGISGVYTNTLDVGTILSVIVTNLLNEQKYFFAVEAYNVQGAGLSPETNVVVTFKDVYEIVMTPLDSVSGTTPFGAYPQTSMLYTNSLPSVYVTYNMRVLPKP